MKVTVLGLWHLGCVTAACVARHAEVIGLDFDAGLIEQLAMGQPPLHEPGLPELIQEGERKGSLCFATDPAIACRAADILWVCYDTPVDEDDHADLSPVLDGIGACVPHLPPGAMVLISSQVPVGTCRRLERRHPQVRFAYTPENLRLGNAIQNFSAADRIVLGVRSTEDANALYPLLRNFSGQIINMRTESAEMTKHAINAFLALSVTFMNEVARLCELAGADAKEVERGLKSESRIGPKAYLAPGGPFAGGTLARDVVALRELGEQNSERLELIPAIKASNDEHKKWALQKLKARYPDLRGKKVAVLGLTYKAGTSTLRRSLAVELCRALLAADAVVSAYDPQVTSLPEDLRRVTLEPTVLATAQGADAVVAATEWPEVREAPWPEVIAAMRGGLVLDANGFLMNQVSLLPGVDYRRVGQSNPHEA
ncbi:MAG TPA: nucleotide sugar dehydrogenase [Chthoniobacterales bacterium]